MLTRIKKIIYNPIQSFILRIRKSDPLGAEPGYAVYNINTVRVLKDGQVYTSNWIPEVNGEYTHYAEFFLLSLNGEATIEVRDSVENAWETFAITISSSGVGSTTIFPASTTPEFGAIFRKKVNGTLLNIWRAMRATVSQGSGAGDWVAVPRVPNVFIGNEQSSVSNAQNDLTSNGYTATT